MQSRFKLAAAVVVVALGGAIKAGATPVNTVFVIAMENHNFTQPGTYTDTQQLYQNSNAPYLNSLITPGNPNAAQVSYATNYGSVGSAVHPSEPNYLWADAGTNFGVQNDNQPFGAGGNNQNTPFHLSGMMSQAGVSWKSYQEDINTDSAGNVLPQSQWTSPITNRSGTYTTVANAYNGSKQYDYAVKHNPMAFFTDTNGGDNTTTSNTARLNYAPLQQLQTDLNNHTVAKYNWITPNQFNDMHTALSGGYTPSFGSTTLTGDSAQIAQGDDFLRQIIPILMASQAYQNNGAIVIWNDETEGGDTAGFNNTEIVISPLAKGNAYNSTLAYTHSSDLRTMQEIFNVGSSDSAATGGVFLNDANNATDLSDLFVDGSIPSAESVTNLVPEPASLSLVALVSFGLLSRRRAMR